MAEFKIFGRPKVIDNKERLLMAMAANIGGFLVSAKADLSQLKQDLRASTVAMKEYCSAVIGEVKTASCAVGSYAMIGASAPATTSSVVKDTPSETKGSEELQQLASLQRQLNAAIDDIGKRVASTNHTELLPFLPEQRRMVLKASSSDNPKHKDAVYSLLDRMRTVSTLDCELTNSEKALRLLGNAETNGVVDNERKGKGPLRPVADHHKQQNQQQGDRRSCGLAIFEGIVRLAAHREALLHEVGIGPKGPTVSLLNRSLAAADAERSASVAAAKQLQAKRAGGAALQSPRRMRSQSHALTPSPYCSREDNNDDGAEERDGDLVLPPVINTRRSGMSEDAATTPPPQEQPNRRVAGNATTNSDATATPHRTAGGGALSRVLKQRRQHQPPYVGTAPSLYGDDAAQAERHSQQRLANMRLGGPTHYQSLIADTAQALRERVAHPTQSVKDTVKYLKHDVALAVGAVGRGLRVEAAENSRDMAEALVPCARNTASSLNTNGAYAVPPGHEDHAANRILQRKLAHSVSLVTDEERTVRTLRLLEKVDGGGGGGGSGPLGRKAEGIPSVVHRGALQNAPTQ